MNKTLIYAGTFREALIWCVNNNRHERSVKYIHDIDMIKGFPRGTEIQIAGSYYKRKDYTKFQFEAILRGFKLIKGKVDTDESNYITSRPIGNIS